MAAPVRSASWLGAEHSSGRGGSEAWLINAHLRCVSRSPRRQNHLRASGKIEARTLHIALHYAVRGEHLTRRLCVPDLASVRVRTSVGSENSVPEKVDHREIAVPVQMVDKVKLLLAPEPSEACEDRSVGVVLLVKIYVRGE